MNRPPSSPPSASEFIKGSSHSSPPTLDALLRIDLAPPPTRRIRTLPHLTNHLHPRSAPCATRVPSPRSQPTSPRGHPSKNSIEKLTSSPTENFPATPHTPAKDVQFGTHLAPFSLTLSGPSRTTLPSFSHTFGDFPSTCATTSRGVDIRFQDSSSLPSLASSSVRPSGPRRPDTTSGLGRFPSRSESEDSKQRISLDRNDRRHSSPHLHREKTPAWNNFDQTNAERFARHFAYEESPRMLFTEDARSRSGSGETSTSSRDGVPRPGAIRCCKLAIGAPVWPRLLGVSLARSMAENSLAPLYPFQSITVAPPSPSLILLVLFNSRLDNADSQREWIVFRSQDRSSRPHSERSYARAE